ncbi:3-isopropylmalate dehydratase small subunit [Luteithermobacter gelatinilyticus]|uniref:3-isopropylmalate dehydratase small subunit n=1 Tax=Luteithermobacter gelatinilyticus TaxID=2582913 RepID=UPI001107232E|nr:3-isopropylmalate dehydratase small subunit [Luteithermobacter gelatinilyticus]
MEPVRELLAVAVPLIRINVDTDAIIPSREMKRVSKKGLSAGLFAGWRYREVSCREPDPGFILNHPDYAEARILLSGANFGCGSSREHAVWALHEYGFRVIVAPSFGTIFYKNCIRNGLLPIELEEKAIRYLAETVRKDPKRNRLWVSLPAQKIGLPGDRMFAFSIAPQDKLMLLEGLDAIDLTLKQQADIEKFQARDRRARPWAYLGLFVKLFAGWSPSEELGDPEKTTNQDKQP